ncbi:hypothetical protein SAMN05421788_11178 [Filimonas lacunae]|uniref:Uncharacterized protein n=1 Tax=Filimonas lacunae TaxID=477680 RepID=A0A1N7RB09_9BACT|nr:hypothetical protein [Filimonas lacunae]SIT32291.1 hypothetical protein SAMN05421788_11178 [Filimonas lacunae]
MKTDKQPLHDTNILLKHIIVNTNHLLTEQQKLVKIAEQLMYAQQANAKQPFTHDKGKGKVSKPPPAFVRSSDVAKLLDYHPRSGDRILREVRIKAGLPPKSPVSVEVFARQYNIPVQEILRIITP